MKSYICGMENKFKTGQKVMCIINSRSSLTVGQEYEILNVWATDLMIRNDNGDDLWYDELRFMQPFELRDHRINELLN